MLRDDYLIMWCNSTTRNNVKVEIREKWKLWEWFVPEDEETKIKENLLWKSTRCIRSAW